MPSNDDDYKVVGMSGWLEKKGKDLFQAWKRRWCVFDDRTKTLSYYDNKQDEGGALKGSIVISAYWNIPDRPDATARIARFDFKASDGVLYAMSAPSDAQKAVWMAKLSTVLGPSTSLTKHPRASEFEGLDTPGTIKVGTIRVGSSSGAGEQDIDAPLNIPTGRSNMTLSAYKDADGQLKVRMPEQEKLQKEKEAESAKANAVASQKRLEEERLQMQAQQAKLEKDVAARELAWEAEKKALRAEHAKDKQVLQDTIQMDLGEARKQIEAITAAAAAKEAAKKHNKKEAWEEEKKALEEQRLKEHAMFKDTLSDALTDAQKQVSKRECTVSVDRQESSLPSTRISVTPFRTHDRATDLIHTLDISHAALIHLVLLCYTDRRVNRTRQYPTSSGTGQYPTGACYSATACTCQCAWCRQGQIQAGYLSDILSCGADCRCGDLGVCCKNCSRCH
jgi:hypothetical protein